MKKLAVWMVVLGIGGGFLLLEFIYPYYRTSIFGYSVEPLANPNQSKARAAVSGLLFDPSSAQFDALRDVEAEGLQYVCGEVDAKDRSGSYSGPREFVYLVKRDIALVDDSEQIARIHDAYKPCPENFVPSLPQPLDLELANKVVTVLKVIPNPDPQILGTLGALLATRSSGAATATEGLQTGLGRFGSSAATAAKDLHSGLSQFQSANALAQAVGSNAPTTQSNVKPMQAAVSVTADLENEREWRGDHPPAAWPAFPSDDRLAVPVRRRTPEQAIAMATNVEQRWNSFKSGRSSSHPRTIDIEEALRTLLTVEPSSKEFPKAWALFVSLRQIDREAGAMDPRPKASPGSSRSRG